MLPSMVTLFRSRISLAPLAMHVREKSVWQITPGKLRGRCQQILRPPPSLDHLKYPGGRSPRASLREPADGIKAASRRRGQQQQQLGAGLSNLPPTCLPWARGAGRRRYRRPSPSPRSRWGWRECRSGGYDRRRALDPLLNQIPLSLPGVFFGRLVGTRIPLSRPDPVLRFGEAHAIATRSIASANAPLSALRFSRHFFWRLRPHQTGKQQAALATAPDRDPKLKFCVLAGTPTPLSIPLL